MPQSLVIRTVHLMFHRRCSSQQDGRLTNNGDSKITASIFKCTGKLGFQSVIMFLFLLIVILVYYFYSTNENDMHVFCSDCDSVYKLITRSRKPIRSGSEIKYDEFFKESPIQSLKSNFDITLYPANKIQVQRLWTCFTIDDNLNSTLSNVSYFHDQQTKIVFIHMYRSAGTTISALLRAYSNFCKVGIAIINHCVDFKAEDTTNDKQIWSNRKESYAVGKPCWLNYAASFSNDKSFVYSNVSKVSTALLKYINADLLVGNLPLGCLDYFDSSNNNNNNTDVQYVVFFREPLSKLISEIYQKMIKTSIIQTNTSIERIIELVNLTVDERMKSEYLTVKYQEKYTNYLITPEQNAWMEYAGLRWTPELRVNITLQNMYSKNIMVGIVNDMKGSLELLKFILDGSDQIDSLFQFFLSDENNANVSNHLVTQSLTNVIVDAIKQDNLLSSMLKEYLKYEYQIYEHALYIHEMQSNSIQYALNASRF